MDVLICPAERWDGQNETPVECLHFTWDSYRSSKGTAARRTEGCFLLACVGASGAPENSSIVLEGSLIDDPRGGFVNTKSRPSSRMNSQISQSSTLLLGA